MYLDTDNLNFPDDLCNLLIQRIWRQSISMERQWRFLQKQGMTDVTAGSDAVDMTFITDLTNPVAVPAERIYTMRFGIGTTTAMPDETTYRSLPLYEYTLALKTYGERTGTPLAWSEVNDGPTRRIRLWPTPSMNVVLVSDFYADLVYPASPVSGGPYDVTFFPLPDEWDDALLEGLLGEMYTREEDPDLAQIHRQNFLEQTGSIRDHWRYSIDTPVVVGGAARLVDPGSGFNDMGAFTAPTVHRR